MYICIYKGECIGNTMFCTQSAVYKICLCVYMPMCIYIYIHMYTHTYIERVRFKYIRLAPTIPHPVPGPPCHSFVCSRRVVCQQGFCLPGVGRGIHICQHLFLPAGREWRGVGLFHPHVFLLLGHRLISRLFLLLPRSTS